MFNRTFKSVYVSGNASQIIYSVVDVFFLQINFMCIKCDLYRNEFYKNKVFGEKIYTNLLNVLVFLKY